MTGWRGSQLGENEAKQKAAGLNVAPAGTLRNLDPAVWHRISAGEPIDVPERTNLGSVTVIEIHAAAPPSSLMLTQQSRSL